MKRNEYKDKRRRWNIYGTVFVHFVHNVLARIFQVISLSQHFTSYFSLNDATELHSLHLHALAVWKVCNVCIACNARYECSYIWIQKQHSINVKTWIYSHTWNYWICTQVIQKRNRNNSKMDFSPNFCIIRFSATCQILYNISLCTNGTKQKITFAIQFRFSHSLEHNLHMISTNFLISYFLVLILALRWFEHLLWYDVSVCKRA